MEATSRLAVYASQETLSALDMRPLRIRLIADAGAALLVLLFATILSVYKPWGLTGYGRRKQDEKRKISRRSESADTSNNEAVSNAGGASWGLYALIGLGCLALLFILVHLAGGGLGQHGH